MEIIGKIRRRLHVIGESIRTITRSLNLSAHMVKSTQPAGVQFNPTPSLH